MGDVISNLTAGFLIAAITGVIAVFYAWWLVEVCVHVKGKGVTALAIVTPPLVWSAMFTIARFI